MTAKKSCLAHSPEFGTAGGKELVDRGGLEEVAWLLEPVGVINDSVADVVSVVVESGVAGGRVELLDSGGGGLPGVLVSVDGGVPEGLVSDAGGFDDAGGISVLVSVGGAEDSDGGGVGAELVDGGGADDSGVIDGAAGVDVSTPGLEVSEVATLVTMTGGTLVAGGGGIGNIEEVSHVQE